MKKSLISTSVAILLASTSAATFATQVGPLTSFTAGTTAVADEVNGNFTTIESSVNHNDTKIGTNTADIATNSADISALQGGASCPSDMTAVGSFCIDTYEASIWDAATGGGQLGTTAPTGGASAYPCTRDGDDCAKQLPTAIYAQSRSGVKPANWVTWYQAAQACANVGKRLPTVAEWQMAALGTPGAPECNLGGTLDDTGSANFADCQSPAGVRDMVGNVMELAADVDLSNIIGNDLDSAGVPRLGNAFDDTAGGGLTTKANVMASSTRGYGSQTGFRCVK